MTPSVELDAELRQVLETARALDEQSCFFPAADPAEIQVSASDAFWNDGGAHMAEIVNITVPGPFRPCSSLSTV